MRELVDHTSNVFDLTNNRIRTLLEDAAILLDHFAVLSPQPFCRELNWGQWILDLVGDASGNIRPGRGSLRGNQLGDVVQSHDIATIGLARLFTGNTDRKIALSAVPADGDLVLRARA